MATATASKTISIIRKSVYGMDLPGIKVHIEGLTPLMMNSADSMRTKINQKGSPLEQASPLVITDQCGHLAIPSFALRSSLCDGAQYLASPVPKKSLKTFLYEILNVLPGYELAEGEEYLTLMRHGQPIPDTDWEIDERRVVMKSTKGAVLRARPKIVLPWSLDAFLVWNEPFSTQKTEQDLVEGLLAASVRAGVCVGLGDFRPQKRGIFGRYKMELAG